jgi:predicted RNA-binding Zn-ribbon protein involved in translation (DUF1610 family)
MRKKTYKIDLTTIEGGGDFPCPKCGILLSPDDESEEVYTIIETYIGDEDNLESMIIRCNKCKSTINLEGFTALLEEDEPRCIISEPLHGSKEGYQTQHTIALDNQEIGTMSVEYAGADDVKAFKKIRKLRKGDAFKATITLATSGELESKDYQEIAKRVRRSFKGLSNQDIYVTAMQNGKRKIVGRASSLVPSEILTS